MRAAQLRTSSGRVWPYRTFAVRKRRSASALTPGVEPLVDRLGEMVLLFAPLRARDPNRVGSFGIASAELVAKQLTELGMVRVAPEIPVDAREKSAVAFQALQEVGGVGASRDLPAKRGADVFETCGFHQETLHVVRLFEEHLRRQEVVHISRGFFGQTSCSCLDHQAGRPTVGAFDERRRRRRRTARCAPAGEPSPRP